MEKQEPDFLDRLQTLTEKILSARLRRIEKKKRREKKRGVLLSWLDAFLWAAMVVLLLNQYFLQAYQIPSGSMRNTLIGGRNPHTGLQDTSDRIFVDKLTLGPELLPGFLKLRGFRESRRSEVVIFENPDYTSPSIFHEVAQRVLYMLSLSLIDLDRRGGKQVHHFLIKRQVAQNGDRVIFRRGELFFLPTGEEQFLREEDFKNFSNLDYATQVLLDEAYYDKLDASIRVNRLESVGLEASDQLVRRSTRPWENPLSRTLIDPYETEGVDSYFLQSLYPQNENIAYDAARYERGIYVPEGWILPLGDNRNDSLDGRYFGPIPAQKILGRALVLYWPLGRLGLIR